MLAALRRLREVAVLIGAVPTRLRDEELDEACAGMVRDAFLAVST
jgi:hypothetical protein